jgi:hypothetical protein
MSFGIPVRNGLGLGLTPSTALSPGARGIRPALLLNFIGTTSLDSRVTFTRALNTATRVNSSGVIELVNANVARFDYNPTTLASKGLLIEEARTNLVVNSSLAGTGGINPTSWLRLLGTNGAQAISTVAASGTSNAWTFTAANNRQAVYQTISVAANTTYYATVYVDQTSVIQSSGNIFSLTNFPAGATVTAEVTTTSAGSRLRYRLDVGATAGSVQFRIGLGVGSNVTGTITLSCPQFELGAFATSYIPTTTTSLTRNADVATVTGANFSSWYAATQGTFVSQFTTSNVSSTATVLDANDATANESIRLRTVTTNPTFTVTDGGVDQANIDAGTVAANTAYKMAGAYAANDFAASISGGAAVTDVSGTLPTVTQLQIGASAAGNILNGCVGSITYYNTRLSNTTLQVLTV